MSNENKVQITVPVPHEIIETQIRLGVAEAIGKNPQALVEAVVKAALQAKRDSYDQKTILQTAIENMIREAAKEAFLEWATENKAVIKAAVLRSINARKGLAEHVATQVTEGIAKSFYVSCNLQVNET